jgi:hypothetical protein
MSEERPRSTAATVGFLAFLAALGVVFAVWGGNLRFLFVGLCGLLILIGLAALARRSRR